MAITKESIQEEALKTLLKNRRATVAIGTGVGKTLIGLNHMSNVTNGFHKILIVAPKKSIFQSWKDDAKKFNKEHLLTNVVFTTYLSLNKHDPYHYDFVYLDECHSLLNSHRTFLSNYSGSIIGLTATPPKYDESEKGKLINEYCPVVYTYIADDAVNDDILNDYKIIVHELNLGTKNDLEVKTKNKSFYTSEKKNYEFWSEKIDNAVSMQQSQMARIMRMKSMMSFKSKEVYTKHLSNSIKSKCIIFANTQEQAERLCQHNYHSNNKKSEENLELFKNDDIMKLSCVQQLNEGVNIPNLKQGIIMHSFGNERQAKQKIGRLLRLNPKDTSIIHILCYVDTVDKKWVTDALEEFNQEKITWKNYNLKLN
jgi:superfamily II DNA or RNA helicase